jgi:hypothetical protein
VKRYCTQDCTARMPDQRLGLYRTPGHR